MLSTPSAVVTSPGSPIATYAPGSTSPGGSTTVYSYGPSYSGPTSAATIESQASPVIVRSTPGAPYSSGAAPSGAAGSAAGTPYSSGTATFAPAPATAEGTTGSPAAASPAGAATGDGMTPIPASTFMFPPMRGGPAAAPSATPSGTMPTPLPGASPTPTAPVPPMRPIPDPEVSPAGPTLGRPAATSPVLIDPKDQTAFAWPTRRTWGYAPIPGRAGEENTAPVVTASYTTVEGATPATPYTSPVSPDQAPAAPVRHASPVHTGGGWQPAGSGGWTPIGR
jgi:collagen type III alpha